MSKASRTIRTHDGREMVMSSDDLTNSDLVVAEVLLEWCVETGNMEITMDDATLDEIARRIRVKGYDPSTGEPIN